MHLIEVLLSCALLCLGSVFLYEYAEKALRLTEKKEQCLIQALAKPT